MCPLGGAGNEMGRKVRQSTPFAEQGKRLRTARLALRGDVSADAYAKDAGLRGGRYSEYEVGARLITTEAALKLKAKYKISLDYIYAGDDIGFPTNNAKFNTGRPDEKR
jgi:hypothetical protein